MARQSIIPVSTVQAFIQEMLAYYAMLGVRKEVITRTVLYLWFQVTWDQSKPMRQDVAYATSSRILHLWRLLWLAETVLTWPESIGSQWMQWQQHFLKVIHYDVIHYDVIKWKHFLRNWSFVRGTHSSPMNSPHKGQWRGALMFSLICSWKRGWVNNGEAGDLRCHRTHYDVTVMQIRIDCGWPAEQINLLVAWYSSNLRTGSTPEKPKYDWHNWIKVIFFYKIMSGSCAGAAFVQSMKMLSAPS